jgi:hypothetical protein
MSRSFLNSGTLIVIFCLFKKEKGNVVSPSDLYFLALEFPLLFVWVYLLPMRWVEFYIIRLVSISALHNEIFKRICEDPILCEA